MVVTTDELDDLLLSKFGLYRSDIIAALHLMPGIRHDSDSLTWRQSRLLDDAGFAENPAVHAAVSTSALVQAGLLIKSTVTATEIAVTLNISENEVLQRRSDGELWAINVDGQWLFPVMQFDANPDAATRRRVRGLAKVFRALPDNLHPLAVASFSESAYPELTHDDQPLSRLDWLRTAAASPLS